MCSVLEMAKRPLSKTALRERRYRIRRSSILSSCTDCKAAPGLFLRFASDGERGTSSAGVASRRRGYGFCTSAYNDETVPTKMHGLYRKTTDTTERWAVVSIKGAWRERRCKAARLCEFKGNLLMGPRPHIPSSIDNGDIRLLGCLRRIASVLFTIPVGRHAAHAHKRRSESK